MYEISGVCPFQYNLGSIAHVILEANFKPACAQRSGTFKLNFKVRRWTELKHHAISYWQKVQVETWINFLNDFGMLSNVQWFHQHGG